MSSPKSPRTMRVRLGVRQSSSNSVLVQGAPAPGESQPRAEKESAAEVAAADKVRRFLRRIVLRRRWVRLIRVMVTKAAIVRRIEADKEAALRRAAAMVLFRVWKQRARSMHGVVRTVMRAQSTAVTRATLEATTFDFSQARELGLPEHVDWQDLAGSARLFSAVVPLQPSDLQARLGELLKEDDEPLLVTEDLEKTRSEVDQLLQATLKSPERPRLPASAEGAQKIDSATLVALVYFSTRSDYSFAAALWTAMITTTREWMQHRTANNKHVSLQLMRLMHLRWEQGSEEVRERVAGCLREWVVQDRAVACDAMQQYGRAMVELLPSAAGDGFCGEDGLLKVLLRTQAQITGTRHRRLDRGELLMLAVSQHIDPIVPPPSAPRPWRVPAIAPLELARQLTLVEHEIFSLIKPSEFFNNAWNSKKKERLAANVLLLTNRFNQMASWVSGLILKEKSPADRAHLIQYFVHVQRELFVIHNYHGVMEMHAVLSSSHVARLRQSWKLVPQVDLMSFARIDGLMSPASNYREYRKLLRAAENMPCIPYVGAWLTDLTMLAETSTWITREEEGLPPMLNVSKLSKISAILTAIRSFQGRPFPFVPQREIGYYVMAEISNAAVARDQDLYNLSLALEPRDPNWQQKMAIRKDSNRVSRFESGDNLSALAAPDGKAQRRKVSIVDALSPRKT